MNDSELVDEIIVSLTNGNPSEAVEALLKGNKTKPCNVAVIASMVTESLMLNNNVTLLRTFVERIKFYHTHNVKF